jgi:2'-5' RNA ligase
VNPDAAHVTLRFVGETSEQNVALLGHALQASLPIAPFDMHWLVLGSFPGGRHPRVIWIGPGEDEHGLAALAALVAARLDPVVGPAEARPFRPHLTLARVRDAARLDWPALLRSIDAGHSISHVDHVTMYRSRLSPKGARYEPLIRAPLVAPH